MGTPDDFPLEAIFMNEPERVPFPDRARPRAESTELAARVAELAGQIAELTEAIRALAARATPAPVVVDVGRAPAATPARDPVAVVAEPVPPRPRRLLDEAFDWPPDEEIARFSSRQAGPDDRAW